MLGSFSHVHGSPCSRGQGLQVNLPSEWFLVSLCFVLGEFCLCTNPLQCWILTQSSLPLNAFQCIAFPWYMSFIRTCLDYHIVFLLSLHLVPLPAPCNYSCDAKFLPICHTCHGLTNTTASVCLKHNSPCIQTFCLAMSHFLRLDFLSDLSFTFLDAYLQADDLGASRYSFYFATLYSKMASSSLHLLQALLDSSLWLQHTSNDVETLRPGTCTYSL